MSSARSFAGLALRASIALAAVLLAAGAGQAADPSRCDNDGDPVPDFAASRDANGCLRVDPGTGGPPITFHHEVIGHGSNPVQSYVDDPVYGNDWYPVEGTGRDCMDEGSDCGMIADNVVLDGYRYASTDVYHVNNTGFKYRLYRNVAMGNAPRCKGGGWTSPGGIRSCDAGVLQSGHVDIIQHQCVGDVNGGWVVWQDGMLVNTNSQHTHINQSGTCGTGVASWVWQGMYVGFLATFGQATNFFADCAAMGGTSTCDFGSAPRWNLSMAGAPVVWVIDSISDQKVGVWFNGMSKVVIVNTGCANPDVTSGNPPTTCQGTRGFSDGWPNPFGSGSSGRGPGVCPNGLIAPPGNITQEDADPGPDVYCYTSLEAALADTSTGANAAIGACPSRSCPHERPPFIHLSNAGWATPPNPGNPPPIRPQPPFLLE